MKKLCMFLAALVIFGVAFAAAQPVAGKKFEFSTAVSFMSFKLDEDEDTFSYMNIPVRLGWFIWKGLEVKPELQLFIPMGDYEGDTTYFLSGRLLYNFKTAGKLVPFIAGGGGYGNGFPIFGILQGDKDTRVTAYGGGAGVRYLIGNIAAVRAEYNFVRFRMEDTVWDYVEKGNAHRFFVGLSIFF